MPGSITDARMMYTDLGFDTLPLAPGSKKTYVRAWQRRPVHRLWQGAPAYANIGIRAGGLANVAIIDCDDKNAPGTFETVTNYLTGLGVSDYPVVETASGVGRHIYVAFGGGLGGDARNLAPQAGAGEFRFGPGAYVVAPPSTISGSGTYRLLLGDFHNLPTLALVDILPILGNQNTNPPRKTIPRLAMALLHGKNTEGYKSKSEAEQALILSLINAGFEYGEVLDLFNHHSCAGKYAELKANNPRNAERWLSHSYREALDYSKHDSPARQKIKATMQWAASSPWPGRTGAVDRLVFMAHMTIAHKAGRLSWAASRRDLAGMAGVSDSTATNATNRLCKANLIALGKAAIGDSANIYRLVYELDKLNHFLTIEVLREWLSLSTGHDLFRQAGLGKRAAQVWDVLQDGPATVDELTRTTGTHAKTIKRALARMAGIVDSHTGEYLPMVASDDDGKTWYPLPADLDKLALVIGTAGIGRRQKEQHAQERRSHARALLMGKRNQDV